LISFQPRLAMPFPLTSFTVIPRNDRQREPTVYQETAERALRDFGPSAAGPCPLRAKKGHLAANSVGADHGSGAVTSLAYGLALVSFPRSEARRAASPSLRLAPTWRAIAAR
jgi:hypothetical protein